MSLTGKARRPAPPALLAVSLIFGVMLSVGVAGAKLDKGAVWPPGDEPALCLEITQSSLRSALAEIFDHVSSYGSDCDVHLTAETSAGHPSDSWVSIVIWATAGGQNKKVWSDRKSRIFVEEDTKAAAIQKYVDVYLQAASGTDDPLSGPNQMGLRKGMDDALRTLAGKLRTKIVVRGDIRTLEKLPGFRKIDDGYEGERIAWRGRPALLDLWKTKLQEMASPVRLLKAVILEGSLYFTFTTPQKNIAGLPAPIGKPIRVSPQPVPRLPHRTQMPKYPWPLGHPKSGPELRDMGATASGD